MTRYKKVGEFYTIGEFLKFCLENHKQYKDSTGDTLEGVIYFSDGSYVDIDYHESWTSDAGTGYSDELTVRYYEPKGK